jgi:hypothetical protein
MRTSLRLGAITAAVSLLLGVGEVTRTLAAGTTGTIYGTVSDTSGVKIADVAVSATAPSYATKTVTGANGTYAMIGLPPDTYLMSFVKSGFQTATRAGITVTQDQSQDVSVVMQSQPKTLAQIPVRGVMSLMQPSQTSSTYTITGKQTDVLNGVPQQIFEGAVIGSLPGVFFDNFGGILIRGGELNEVGYQLDGVENTEPVTGQFINSLALNGVSRLVLSTGGYDVSNGNTNAGIVNVVAKRGSYPGAGQFTASVNAPNFQHTIGVEYGSSTPDNRFSYYYSFRGIRQVLIAGDGKVIYPTLYGATQDTSGNDNLFNFYYHFGSNNQNELQYFADFGDNLFNRNYGIDPTITPYTSNNTFDRLITGAGSGLFVDPAYGLVDSLVPFPGQAGLRQMTGYWDHEDENHTIQKINYKHQFSATSFFEVTGFRTQSQVNFLLPWNGGALGADFEFVGSDNQGIGFDYNNQINSQNLVSIGGETIFTKPNAYANAPASALFQTPLECGEICAIAGFTTEFNPAMPQGYVGKIQQELGFPAAGPLATIPDSSSLITSNLHRSNIWVKDEFRPSDRWTVVAGLRWDQEVFDFPSNLAALNTQYIVDASGNYVEVPGPTIGTNVTRPSMVSPRVAATYQASARDNFRASYGRNIEFVPMADIESQWNVSTSLKNCTIASGCFAPLPGFGTTNNITNLYQQIIEDLNTHAIAQYSPVLPQTATNADFSWTHEFNHNIETRITPYYRKGQNYVVGNTPILFTLPGNVPVFGTTRNSNAGINQSTGIEFAASRQVAFGLSSLISVSYDNTLANYNSDFFPTTNEAALVIGHLYHVSYIPWVQATANFNYVTRNGWKFIATFPYESGYRYGVGTKTFIFSPTTGQPEQVLNTDLAEGILGNSAAASAYYFTDPANPGTPENPNITGSRGTKEGPDPGSIIGPQILTANFTLAHEIGNGEIGIFANNPFGNFTSASPFTTSNYLNNGFGGYGPGSGNAGAFLQATQPYVFDLNPTSYITYPDGNARLYTFYYTTRI